MKYLPKKFSFVLLIKNLIFVYCVLLAFYKETKIFSGESKAILLSRPSKKNYD